MGMYEDIAYWNTPEWTNAFLWVVILGFLVCFLLAFGMGSNDCANSYGTLVGGGVLTLYKAYILATIFETMGAVMLGYKVVDTVRSGIVNLEIYDISSYKDYNDTTGMLNRTSNSSFTYMSVADTSCSALETKYNIYNNVTNRNVTEIVDCTESTDATVMFGELGAITGTAFWLILASCFKMPVSATQSIVGATVGFSLVLKGSNGIKWMELVKIVLSWVASPLMAGAFSSIFYAAIYFFVFKQQDQVAASVRFLPFALFFTLALNFFTVFFEGSKWLGLENINWWQAALISIAIGIVVALLTQFWLGAKIKRWAERLHAGDVAKEKEELEMGKRNGSYVSDGTDLKEEVTAAEDHENVAPENPNWLQRTMPHIDEDPVANRVFDVLQIVSSSFLAFSHGSNDTANSIGPLTGLWLLYSKGQANYVPPNGAGWDQMGILLFGTASMLIGLWLMGHKVIETIGSDITKINASSGFAMTLGTAFTVILASKVGIPVSTTHCMVGAVIFVGIFRNGNAKAVHWGLFRNIAFAWLVTTPVAGIVSAAVTAIFSYAYFGKI